MKMKWAEPRTGGQRSEIGCLFCAFDQTASLGDQCRMAYRAGRLIGLTAFAGAKARCRGS